MVEFTAAEQTKEKRMKRNEDSIRDLWDNIKCNNIHIIEVSEAGEREKGAENIFHDVIAENFTNVGRKMDIQVQEAQRVPYRINPKRNTTRYIVIKMEKLKIKREY